jgi:uncharacterized SAM-binding protein YcdF (DUF218 family)
MSWFFTNLVSALLLPPLNLLLLSLAGLLLWRIRPRAARILLSSAFILLWLFSTPFLAESMLHTLEGPPLVLNHNSSTADAIVVLGGGTYFNAPEYAGDTVSTSSLLRLRYAAKLYRDSKKPILLTGGKPLGNSISEALLMKRVLEQEFNTPVTWIEEESDNTLESARYSYRVLRNSGVKRIYLVTHAWHMPRAAKVFKSAGFEVIAAPTAYTTRYNIDLLAFIPSANALRDNQIYLHEIIGILWYRLKS